MVYCHLPRAVELRNISACIRYVLDQEIATLVVICSSREEFLRDLASELSPSQEPGDGERVDHEIFPTLDLLNPTIKLIARSKHVRVAYVPTLRHLRAYLSSLNSREAAMEANTRLAVLNLLELHRSTSEFSAQGISRTLALLVDTASQNDARLDILEGIEYREVDEASGRPTSHFNEGVPILNGSTRSTGDERVWAGRTVEIGSILAKWCKVVKMSQTQ
ncbi:hypothetical protein MMC10_002317 [Thelotrema lepadinum]|nr:hypothetical protein [Thelotrema lepadinum]